MLNSNKKNNNSRDTSSLSAEKTTFSYSHVLMVLEKEFPALKEEVNSFKKKVSVEMAFFKVLMLSFSEFVGVVIGQYLDFKLIGYGSVYHQKYTNFFNFSIY